MFTPYIYHCYKIIWGVTKMKKCFVILQIILGVLSFPTETLSQCDMQNYIGKSQSELIKKLGKPAYIDDSNKSMVMIFYKSPDISKSFVADKNGIYQAEATQSFVSEKTCKATLNAYIADIINKGYSVDTISVSEFQSDKPGVTCNIQCGLNTVSGKYDIRVKAHKKES